MRINIYQSTVSILVLFYFVFQYRLQSIFLKSNASNNHRWFRWLKFYYHRRSCWFSSVSIHIMFLCSVITVLSHNENTTKRLYLLFICPVFSFIFLSRYFLNKQITAVIYISEYVFQSLITQRLLLTAKRNGHQTRTHSPIHVIRWSLSLLGNFNHSWRLNDCKNVRSVK